MPENSRPQPNVRPVSSGRAPAPQVLGEEIYQAVQFDKVIRQSGKVSRQLQLSIPPHGSHYDEIQQSPGHVLVFLQWPKEWSFFSMSAWTEEPLNAEQRNSEKFQPRSSRQSQARSLPTGCTGDAAELANWLVGHFGYTQEQAQSTTSGVVANYKFNAIVFPLPGILSINVDVKTDDTVFCRWTRDQKARSMLKWASYSNDRYSLQPRFSLIPSRGTAAVDAWKKWMGDDLQFYRSLLIELGDVGDLAESDGFLGFDIGNNASTVSRLNRDATGSHDAVELFEVESFLDISVADNGTECEALLSTVRIDRFNDDKKYGEFPAAEWKVGKEAIEISELSKGQLFSSVKRYLGDPSRRDKLYLSLNRGFEIDRTLPAELLITSLLQRVHQLSKQKSYPAVATYPSTYTKAEIEQVRVGIAKALCRSLNRSDLDEITIRKGARVIIPRMYDEASSAAFFFLFRDFNRGPARLHGFHYLYPRGMNMLLIDCGGGTTDIALIHAVTDAKDKDVTGQSVWRMRLANLGRAGNRFFGGDNVTAAFCRVLKWYLASVLDDEIEAFPRDESEWLRLQASFKQIEDQVDRVLRTRAPKNLNQVIGNAITPAERMRINAIRGLWKYAEDVKKSVGRGDGLPAAAGTLGHLADLAARLRNDNSGNILNEWSNESPDIEVLSSIVNWLIKPEIDLVVNSANALIGQLNHRLKEFKLSSNAEPHAFLHHVYLVGQGALYPFIQTELKHRLNVPFLGDPAPVDPKGKHPRFVFDKQHLKGAVARGATLLRMAETNMQGVEVLYDEDLSERLPFSVGYDPDKMAAVSLYKEHSKYSELTPKQIKAPRPKRNGESEPAPLSLMLKRLWPGSTDWEPFLEFTFKGLADPLPQKRSPQRQGGQAPIDIETDLTIEIHYDDDPKYASTLGFFAKVIGPSDQVASGRVIWRKENKSPLESGDL